MNLGMPFTETIGDGFSRGHSNSFPVENQQGKVERLALDHYDPLASSPSCGRRLKAGAGRIMVLGSVDVHWRKGAPLFVGEFKRGPSQDYAQHMAGFLSLSH